MKKITLSVLVMLFLCITVNAFNSSTTKNTKPLTVINPAEESASDKVNLNGFLFEFLGVQYNPDGTSTWTYKVKGLNARRHLSEWKLKLLDDHNVVSSSPNNWETEIDPRFQYYGIKWNSLIHKRGDSKTFSFTLDGKYDVGEIDFGYKAGKFYHGTIQGPKNNLSLASINGKVFNDINSNGIKDDVEEFVSNVQIDLYNDVNGNGLIDNGESILETTTTNEVGEYSFDNCKAGSIIINAILPSDTPNFSYKASTPMSISKFLTANDVMTVDFGIKKTEPEQSFLESNVSNTVNLNGFLFEFLGVQYNPDGTSTWTYKVTGKGARKDLSHWKLKLLDEQNVTSSSPNTWEVHVDPHFKYYGIKWDSSVKKKGGTKTFSFTLNGRYDVADSAFGYKAGRDLFHGTIQGPGNLTSVSISGTVFNDTNANGVQDGVEGFLPNIQIDLYDDTNANGIIDNNESILESATTDDFGVYTFNNIFALNVIVKMEVPDDTSNFSYQTTTPLTISEFLTVNDMVNVDFGINRVEKINYNISGIVYDDNNENATLDNTETGRLENITLTLYLDDGDGRIGEGDTVIASTTSASDGTYSFNNVTTQNTLVVVTVPINDADFRYKLTSSKILNTSSVSTDITDANFGINKKPTSYDVSGNVFNDTNLDGVNDANEAGLSGITINLFDDVNLNGRVDRGEPIIESTTSDRNGNYLFDGVTDRNVIVRLVMPANTEQYTYIHTTQQSVAITGGVSTTIDFGINKRLVILYSISGAIWNDQNDDQIKDENENSLSNVIVTLYEDVNADGTLDANDISRSVSVTDANGEYQFTAINLRNVLIVPTAPTDGIFTTTENRAISSLNTDVDNVDFGIKIEDGLFKVSGVVFDDQNENGVIDNGEKSIDGLPVQIYVDTDGSGTLDTNLDLLIAFTETSNSGFGFLNPNFLVDGIPSGQIFVRVVIPEDTIFVTYTPTYDPDSGTDNPDGIFPTLLSSDIENVNFGLKVTDLSSDESREPEPYFVSGNVFNDENSDGVNDATEAGLNGVTIRLFDDINKNGRLERTDTLITETTSSRSGNYELTGITATNVIVQMKLPGNTPEFTYTPTTPISDVITDGVSRVVDFGIKKQLVISYNVSGVIWDDQNANQIIDANETKLSGVEVALYEDVNTSGTLDNNDVLVRSLVTNLDGEYSFIGINNRNVLVVPTALANGTFTTPSSKAVASISTDVTDVDFGIKIGDNLFGVSGVVFDDQNENGIIDDGESSVNGVQVELYVDTDGSGTLNTNLDTLIAFTYTSSGGVEFLNPNYIIDSVPSEQIFVRLIIPESTIFVSYQLTSDPDSGTKDPDGIFLTSLDGDLDSINFGLKVVDLLSKSITKKDVNPTTTEDVSERLILYPNPTVNKISINSQEFVGDVTVEIYNERGYNVLTKKINPSRNKLNVDVNNLAPGKYFVKFRSKNKVANKKFIKR